MTDPTDAVPLPDGSYDAFVIDVDEGPDGRATRLELTLTAGDHKGEVLGVAVGGLDAGMVELVGMPATVVVTHGRPTVTIDP